MTHYFGVREAYPYNHEEQGWYGMVVYSIGSPSQSWMLVL